VPEQRVRIEDGRQRFSHVPFPLINAMRQGLVPMAAVALYAALDQYRDRQTARAWPGIRALARDIGLSHGRVHQLLQDLERAGFITIERDKNPSRPAVYTLRYAPPPKPARGSGSRPAGWTRPARVHPDLVSAPLTPLGVDPRVQSPISTSSISSEFHVNQPAARGSGSEPDPDPVRTARFRRLVEDRRRRT